MLNQAPLQKLRQHYLPTLPSLLNDLSTVQMKAEQTLEVLPEIEKAFPKISRAPVVKGNAAGKRSFKPMRVGVVFSGGQAAGGHNVISGIFDALKKMHPESDLIGFLDGPEGVVCGKSKEITKQMVDLYRNQGGFDLIGSGRLKIKTEEQFHAVLKSVKNLNLDGLVIIGGDDSNTNAALLAEFFLEQNCLTKVIGVPKTIDGDLRNDFVEISFGFDTATKTYSELIGNLARDALSSKKYTHFIKLMGRSASHVSLECALATHPNLTLISEEKKSLSQITSEIADLVMERSRQGKNYGLILIPEGLVEFMPDLQTSFSSLPERIQKQFFIEKDPHGNLNVSAIETDLLLIETVTEELHKRGFKEKFSPLAHFFGYEGRSAFPSNFDANYCYTLGHVAALLIDSGLTGYMSFVSHLKESPKHWTIGGVPLASLLHLEDRHGKMSPVIAKALINLKGKAYQQFKNESARWAIEDDYRFPGPIQFFGSPDLADSVPLSI